MLSIVFVVSLFLLVPFTIGLLLLLTALMAVFRLALFVRWLLRPVASRIKWRSLLKVLLPVVFLLLSAGVFGWITEAIRGQPISLYNAVGAVLGGVVVLGSITGWLARVFTGHPLSNAEFEQAMSALTEATRESNAEMVSALTEATRESNAEMVSALTAAIRDSNAEVVSALSVLPENIVAVLEARAEGADDSALPGEAEQ